MGDTIDTHLEIPTRLQNLGNVYISEFATQIQSLAEYDETQDQVLNFQVRNSMLKKFGRVFEEMLSSQKGSESYTENFLTIYSVIISYAIQGTNTTLLTDSVQQLQADIAVMKEPYDTNLLDLKHC